MADKIHGLELKCGMYSTPMSSSLVIPGCTYGERKIRFCPRLEAWERNTTRGNNVKQELLKAKRDILFCVTAKEIMGLVEAHIAVVFRIASSKG